MKLQFLIPQYKETDEVIKPLLDSIALQQNIDLNEIGVIITNDGTDVRLSDKLLNSYPFKIEYLLNEHKGVSAARNYCFDHATADYVMFCDADDMFYNMCGLWLIFNDIVKGFDVYISYFVEETRDQNGKPQYIIHKEDATFVHGKAFRRQYLIDKDIRWKEEFTIHEDSYFNYLAQSCAAEGQIKLCKNPFYMWKWNKDSVCRRDKLYIFKTYNCLLDSSTQLLRDLMERKLWKHAQKVATNIIYDTYYMLNKEGWLDKEHEEYKLNVEKRFKKYYLEFKHLFDTIDINEKKVIARKAREKKCNEGLFMESITFDNWIENILML